MSEPMTLDAIVRILEDSTCGFVRLSPDKVAATVRAAELTINVQAREIEKLKKVIASLGGAVKISGPDDVGAPTGPEHNTL